MVNHETTFSSGRGGDSGVLRAINLQATLRALWATGPQTISEVARATGLSRPTANQAITELIAAGWIESVDSKITTQIRSGRPAQVFRFRPAAGHVLGIDMGAHKALVLVADLSGEIIAEHRATLDPESTFQRRLTQLDDAVMTALSEAGLADEDVTWAGVATPGVVDAGGRVTYAPAIPDWEGVDLVSHLREVFGISARVLNDMHLAAVAEHWQGAGRDASDVVYVHVGRRIGTGLLIDGKPHVGRNGAAGELGLWRGLPWAGAYDELASAPEASQGRAVQDVFDRARDGDGAAHDRIERFVDRLVEGIAPVIVTINPELVIIGGGISAAGEAIRQPVDRRLPAETAFPPRVVCSILGDRSSAIGAVRTALDAAEQELFDALGVRSAHR